MKPLFVLIIGIILLTCCSAPEKKTENATEAEKVEVKTQIDHIMVGVFDLEAGVAQLEDLTGVTAGYGGIHPGRDTRNSLLSLGNGTYFELVAPQANLDTITNPLAQYILGLDKPTPIKWAVSTTNIDETKRIVDELGWKTSEIREGGRDKPDGTHLSWRNFGIGEPDAGTIPFFIEWGEGSVHPSVTSTEGCNLKKLVIKTSMKDKLSKLYEALGVEVEIQEAEDESLELILDCSGNEVKL